MNAIIMILGSGVCILIGILFLIYNKNVAEAFVRQFWANMPGYSGVEKYFFPLVRFLVIILSAGVIFVGLRFLQLGNIIHLGF